MGWSSDNYHYTKEEIQPTAYAAGCGDGWYWIHKRPNMFIQGYIHDDGSYNLTFYKAIASQFDYTLKLTINNTVLMDMPEFSALDNKTYKKTFTGKLPIGSLKAIVKLYCGDKSCDVNAGVPEGRELLNIDLYPYVRIFNNGQWKRAMAYVYTNNQWKLCIGYVFNNNGWKRLTN